MYYQNYEDYMRAVLGYPLERQNTYQMNYYEDTQKYVIPYDQTKELEDFYPEIYKMINPIVCEVCDRNSTNNISIDAVENMVEEIYKRIELNNEIEIKINIDNRCNEKEEAESRINTIKSNCNRNINNELSRKNLEIANRQRKPNNSLLRDLIRILVLNRLLGRNLGPRPPYLRPPIRPPFPREGILQRQESKNYDDYFKF